MFTVGVSRQGDGFLWVVRDDHSDELVGEGSAERWPDALTRATTKIAMILVNEYGVPPMSVYGLTPRNGAIGALSGEADASGDDDGDEHQDTEQKPQRPPGH